MQLVSVREKFYISDISTVAGVKLLAYVSMIAGFYLALFGHRSPGVVSHPAWPVRLAYSWVRSFTRSNRSSKSERS